MSRPLLEMLPYPPGSSYHLTAQEARRLDVIVEASDWFERGAKALRDAKTLLVTANDRYRAQMVFDYVDANIARDPRTYVQNRLSDISPRNLQNVPTEMQSLYYPTIGRRCSKYYHVSGNHPAQPECLSAMFDEHGKISCKEKRRVPMIAIVDHLLCRIDRQVNLTQPELDVIQTEMRDACGLCVYCSPQLRMAQLDNPCLFCLERGMTSTDGNAITCRDCSITRVCENHLQLLTPLVEMLTCFMDTGSRVSMGARFIPMQASNTRIRDSCVSVDDCIEITGNKSVSIVLEKDEDCHAARSAEQELDRLMAIINHKRKYFAKVCVVRWNSNAPLCGAETAALKARQWAFWGGTVFTNESYDVCVVYIDYTIPKHVDALKASGLRWQIIQTNTVPKAPAGKTPHCFALSLREYSHFSA